MARGSTASPKTPKQWHENRPTELGKRLQQNHRTTFGDTFGFGQSFHGCYVRHLQTLLELIQLLLESFCQILAQVHHPIEYQTEKLPGTNRPVVNPLWRDLDKRVRSVRGKLQRQQVEFAALTMHPETDEQKKSKKKRKDAPTWEQRKSQLVESIEQLEHELAELQEQRAQTPHHLEWEALPADDKFERLAPSRKRHEEPIIVTVNGVPSFQLVPLSEEDDLIDSLLEHSPKFRQTLKNRLKEKSVSAKEARKRI